MRWINKIEEICCVSSLLMASFLVFLNVMMRYLFKSGLNWSEELTRYLFIIVTFWGISIGVRRNARISVDILALSLRSESAKKILELIINVIQLIFAVTVMLISLKFSVFIFSTGQISSALKVPIYYLYLIIAIGSLLLSTSTLKEIFNTMKSRVI